MNQCQYASEGIELQLLETVTIEESWVECIRGVVVLTIACEFTNTSIKFSSEKKKKKKPAYRMAF